MSNHFFFETPTPYLAWTVTCLALNCLTMGWIKEVPPNSSQIHTMNARTGFR